MHIARRPVIRPPDLLVRPLKREGADDLLLDARQEQLANLGLSLDPTPQVVCEQRWKPLLQPARCLPVRGFGKDRDGVFDAGRSRFGYFYLDARRGEVSVHQASR
jgi:hypothetical protein